MTITFKNLNNKESDTITYDLLTKEDVIMYHENNKEYLETGKQSNGTQNCASIELYVRNDGITISVDSRSWIDSMMTLEVYKYNFKNLQREKKRRQESENDD